MDTGLIVSPPEERDRQLTYRIGMYEGLPKGNPLHPEGHNLQAFVDGLVKKGYEATSISSIVSTVRQHLLDKIKDENYQNAIIAKAEEEFPGQGFSSFQVWEKRYNDSIARVKTPKIIIDQDETDDKHIRLTLAECRTLLETIAQRDDLIRKRDLALISLALMTGARAGEVLDATVESVHAKANGMLGLKVTRGKGSKARFIPYGDGGLMQNIDDYIAATGITTGHFFQSYFKGNSVRSNKMSYDTVRKAVMPAYAIWRDSYFMTVDFHDLRRSYARLQWEAGCPVEIIQQNLGHSDREMTMRYIGILTPVARAGKVNYGN